MLQNSAKSNLFHDSSFPLAESRVPPKFIRDELHPDPDSASRFLIRCRFPGRAVNWPMSGPRGLLDVMFGAEVMWWHSRGRGNTLAKRNIHRFQMAMLGRRWLLLLLLLLLHPIWLFAVNGLVHLLVLVCLCAAFPRWRAVFLVWVARITARSNHFRTSAIKFHRLCHLRQDHKLLSKIRIPEMEERNTCWPGMANRKLDSLLW